MSRRDEDSDSNREGTKQGRWTKEKLGGGGRARSSSGCYFSSGGLQSGHTLPPTPTAPPTTPHWVLVAVFPLIHTQPKKEGGKKKKHFRTFHEGKQEGGQQQNPATPFQMDLSIVFIFWKGGGYFCQGNLKRPHADRSVDTEKRRKALCGSTVREDLLVTNLRRRRLQIKSAR